MKIGIMGGTFDPIHNGHLMLGEYAYRKFSLDEVWFMPNGRPPHKSEITIGSKIQQRLDMIQLAISKVPYFKLSLYEIVQNKVCYSYQTMRDLKAEHPDKEFYFIIGADSLFTIESWRYPARLFQVCSILAAFREGKDPKEMKRQIAYLNDKYRAHIELLETPVFPVSSSRIRGMIKEDVPIEGLAPDEVASYIEVQHLYEDGE